jgi:hypothetical protein
VRAPPAARWRRGSPASVLASTALSGSSRTRIFGSHTSARASAMRCFCPPESCTPRSPTTVSNCSGSPAPPRAPAPRAPRRDRSSLRASRDRRARSRCCARRSSRRGTRPAARSRCGAHRRERQLADVEPVDAHGPRRRRAERRARSIASVVLPEPVRPTMASDSPGATFEAHVVEHLAVAVRERRALHASEPLTCARRAARPVDDLGLRVEDSRCARTRATALHDREREAERDHRPRHPREAPPEREEVPLA